MPWINGVYSRGYPSWTNDAASNLPISATKFDTEDNDFASGLNNCITKDGLSTPSSALTWSLSSAQILQLNRGSDGAVFGIGRTGGSTNPSFKFSIADAGGLSISDGTGNFTINDSGAVTIATPGAGIGLTVNGFAGAFVAQFSSATAGGTTSTDVYVTRNGSTINTLGQGPTLQLADISGTNGSILQNSGGQTEFWQNNSNAWNQVMKFTTSRGVVINTPSSGSSSLYVSNTGTGTNSNGLTVYAGSSTSNFSLIAGNAAATANFLVINGVGNTQFNASSTANGIGTFAVNIQAPTGVGASYGVLISAGTGTDTAFQVNNAANSTNLLLLNGAGAMTLAAGLTIGNLVSITSQSVSTSASAGTNGAPPAQVAGYMNVSINGTNRHIPYYV